MPLSLNTPAALLTCSLADLRATTRAVHPWTEMRARQLDQVIRGRLVDALVASKDPTALSDLYDTVMTLVPHSAHTVLRQLEQDWIARWWSWADLLDARVAQLNARDHSRVRYLRHVPELLTIIGRGHGPTQTALANETGLTAPNISRLLRILEDHDLIERRQAGQAKRVYPATLSVVPSDNASDSPAPQPMANTSNQPSLAAALAACNKPLDPFQAGLHQAAA